MTAAEKISAASLTEAQATLLMPLWARAVESAREKAILVDRTAQKIVETLDFDFSQFERRGVPQADYCIRASVIDRIVRTFIAQHPGGTVVEFGVGLDTRFDRLDNGTIHWVELDLPDVMNVRRNFFQPGERRVMLSGSLTESTWLDDVERAIVGPKLFVAEGVLYFLTDPEVDSLVLRLANRFPGGGFTFDAQSPWFLAFSNARQPVSNAQMKFSLGSPQRFTRLDSRIRVEECVGYGDSPHYDGMMHRLSSFKRWSRRLFPWVRNMFKIVRLGW